MKHSLTDSNLEWDEFGAQYQEMSLLSVKSSSINLVRLQSPANFIGVKMLTLGDAWPSGAP